MPPAEVPPAFVHRRFRLLDLFCGQGGAGKGYQLAGLEVVGVDLNGKRLAKHHAPCVREDAIKFAADHGAEYDAIHASPPCQRFSIATPTRSRHHHADLIGPTREALLKLGKPFVIENVPGAYSAGMLEKDRCVMLCGSMFGLRCQRHRHFECHRFAVPIPPPCDHSLPPLLVTTAGANSRAKRAGSGARPKSVANAPAAYGIDWMTADGLKEAIPPSYTRWIGLHLTAQLLMKGACQ